MRRTRALAGPLAILFFVSVAQAQSGTVAPPSGTKTLAATVGVYVFPTEGQAGDQQSKDEAECYKWAVQQTGADPFDVAEKAEKDKAQAEQAKKQAGQAGKGAGAKGAVGGAAAGALIGAIAGDAGKGAAIGAGAGLIAGKRKGAKAEKSAKAGAQNQAQQAEANAQAQTESFRKAFSVCLEAKKYMVKY